MNTKNLLIASLAGGLISAVLVNAPYVGFINILLCAGFWIGPLAAVWLYRRLHGSFTLGQAMLIGLLAGAWHALFGLLLSPLGLAGAGALLSGAGSVMPAQGLVNLEATLTGFGGAVFNLLGVAIDLAFGFIGGLMGGLFFRPRHANI
jgi:hypothetical protein